MPRASMIMSPPQPTPRHLPNLPPAAAGGTLEVSAFDLGFEPPS